MAISFLVIILFGFILLALPAILLVVGLCQIGKGSTGSLDQDRLYQEACRRLEEMARRVENLETILIKRSGS